jgi:DNA-directed RNA polymerase specialized sigma24 family protein
VEPDIPLTPDARDVTALYENYRVRLRRFLAARNPSVHLDGIEQDVWVKIIRKVSSRRNRNPRSTWAWLCRVADTTRIDRYRQRQRRERYEDAAAEEWALLRGLKPVQIEPYDDGPATVLPHERKRERGSRDHLPLRRPARERELAVGADQLDRLVAAEVLATLDPRLVDAAHLVVEEGATWVAAAAKVGLCDRRLRQLKVAARERWR